MTPDQERAALRGMIADYVSRADARLPQILRGKSAPTASYTLPILNPPAPLPPDDEDETLEPDPDSPIRYLTDSDWLYEDIPDVDLPNAVILTPASYASWAACFAANPLKLDFLLSPGDYTAWGPIDTYNRVFGTAMRFKTIRYYNPGVDDDVHPVNRLNQARVAGVKITGPSSQYLVVQGLQIKNGIVNSGASLEAQWIIFDHMLVEECEIYGLRMNAVQNCSVQRSVLRNMVALAEPGDSVGVQFKNVDGLAFDTIDNFLLDCEIYNCGDSYGFTEAVTLYQPIEVVVDGNDFYIEASEYVNAAGTPDVNGTRTWRENALDIKAGSSRTGKNPITNNRMWGFRRNAAPTALGEAMVFQKYARGFDVEDNVIDDCPRGMKDENWPTTKRIVTPDHTADTFTDVGHHLTTGAGPIVLAPDGGATVPTGTTANLGYWVIYISDDVFKIAASYADALAGTAVTFSSNGTGIIRWRTDSTATRSIHFRRNDWLNITDKDPLDIGAVYKPITNISYEDEFVSECTYLCDISPTIYYGPTFVGITRSNVSATQRPEDQIPVLPYDPGLNSDGPTPAAGYERYERKRWTGSEYVARAKPWIP